MFEPPANAGGSDKSSRMVLCHPAFFVDNQRMPLFSEHIKQKAAEIGFQKVGIVPAEPLVDEGDRLKDWLGRGFNGEMAWLEREPEKRSNPRLLFPKAKLF